MLTVKACEEWATFRVLNEEGETVRSYSNASSAWDHAIWQPLAVKGLIPITGPGGLLKATDGGWTSDPRQAKTKPVAESSQDEVKAARMAAVKFIQAVLKDDPIGVFMTETLADHDPNDYEADLIALAESHESYPSDEELEALEREALEAIGEDVTESVARGLEQSEAGELVDLGDFTEYMNDEDIEDSTDDAVEDVRASLNERDRLAFDNFSELAEVAPSESGRAYWQGKVTEVLAGEFSYDHAL